MENTSIPTHPREPCTYTKFLPPQTQYTNGVYTTHKSPTRYSIPETHTQNTPKCKLAEQGIKGFKMVAWDSVSTEEIITELH